MKIKTIQDLGSVPTWEELRRFASQTITEIIDVVNGRLNLTENGDLQEISVTFPAAGTDVTVNHGLGRVPTRYIVTSNSTGIVPYAGSSAFTASQIVLKATGAGTVTLLLE